MRTQDGLVVEMRPVKYNLDGNTDSIHFFYLIQLAAKLIKVTGNTRNTTYNMMKKCSHETTFTALEKKVQGQKGTSVHLYGIKILNPLTKVINMHIKSSYKQELLNTEKHTKATEKFEK